MDETTLPLPEDAQPASSDSKVMTEPIVFFGAGDVAARSLKMLAQSFTIEAVVTKPRPEHHHGSWPVLELAQVLDLPVVEVANKKETTARVTSAGFKSRVGVLIDFGIIVEQQVIDLFPLGIVNSHFSLLPQWRGADPITFSILSGQSKTGVSLMLLVEKMDEGPLLAVGEIDITPTMTTPELTSHLIGLSATLLKDILPKYLDGEVVGASQEKVADAVGYSGEPSYSRKLTKEDGILDWAKPAVQLEREIRAYADWPKSRCIIGGHAVIITEAHVEAGEGTPGAFWLSTAEPSGITPDNNGTTANGTGTRRRSSAQLGIYTSKGVLMIDRLKPAGKGEMPIAAFLNGYSKDL
jgi:methionyl-tRNA formyltransferase